MIAFDSNVLIYYLEAHSEFGPAARSVLGKASRKGAVVSALLVQEVLSGFALSGPKNLQLAQQAIAAMDNVKFIPATSEICSKAAELTGRYGKNIYGYDAIHLATAINSAAKEFYTNDHTLIKIGKVGKLKILSLV